jgi:hypothetical protein
MAGRLFVLALGVLLAVGLATAAERMWAPAYWPVLAATLAWWLVMARRQAAALRRERAPKMGDFH